MTQLSESYARESSRGASPRGGTDDGGRQSPWRAEPDARQAQPTQQNPINVGTGKRAVSVAAGAIVALLGLSRGSLPGLLVAGVGGALAYRGVTGHCPAYESLGLDTAHAARPGSDGDDIAERGIHIEQALTINRPASQLYQFWRNFENLPRIMTHLESVRVDRRPPVALGRQGEQALGGKRFEWDAEITGDEPNQPDRLAVAAGRRRRERRPDHASRPGSAKTAAPRCTSAWTTSRRPGRSAT